MFVFCYLQSQIVVIFFVFWNLGFVIYNRRFLQSSIVVGYKMIEVQNSKIYDLEERTFQFAKNVRLFIKSISRNISNLEDGKQLIRSSGSIGANYIEANEPLGKKDFLMRIRISRKESKESIYWLKLIDTTNSNELEKLRINLIKEATELLRILSSIIRKSE